MTNTDIIDAFVHSLPHMANIPKPILEDWEKVLGRQFTCRRDCYWYWTNRTKYRRKVCSPGSFSDIHTCNHVRLMDKTKAEIKLHDYELYPAGKVDTHPRYLIKEMVWEKLKEIEIPTSLSEFNPNMMPKIAIEQIRMRLEIVL